MTGLIDLVLVVVPVRDEVDRIAACLISIQRAIAALSESAGIVSRPEVRTVAILDQCTDGTDLVVAEHPWVESVISAAGRVGAARALGVRSGLRASTVAAERIWIATTDADSRVPSNWLSHQIELAEGGADLFRGLVEPDPTECGAAAYAHWSRSYSRTDGHPHVHGANLGVRADTYWTCGGFDHLAAVHEDKHLSATATRHARNVVASAQARVATSGRLVSRVEGDGFAAYLRGAAQLAGEMPAGAT